MRKKIETIIVFLFLSLFSLATIYPVLNVLGVSLRTDNAFQTKSLSIFKFKENYIDSNGNGTWDFEENYIDSNNNGKWDAGSSFKSYWTLFNETDFFLWARNSILISVVVTMTGVVFASIEFLVFFISIFIFSGRKATETELFKSLSLSIFIFISANFNSYLLDSLLITSALTTLASPIKLATNLFFG